MIDALRTLRRPAPGFGWRALALYVGPALLVVATLLPTVLLLARLPTHLAPPYQRRPAAFLVGAEVSSLCMVAGWVCVAAVVRRARHPNRRTLWELGVPLLYGLGGYLVAFSVRDLVLDLDRPYALRSVAPGPFEVPAIGLAVLACASVGMLLGRRAAATEPAPRSGARAVWIAEVDADRSWWLIQAVGALAACLLLGVPYVLTRSWAGVLQADAGVAGIFALVCVWASRGHVSISPWGIRASYGHVPLLGCQLPIGHIASVEVGRVRLLRTWAAWQCLSNLALRDGPALIVRTRAGERRVVTVPDAEDAAAALRTWLGQRHEASA